eukprot:g2396.t1
MAGETTTASCSKVSLNSNAACAAPGLLKGGTSSVVLNNYQFQAFNSNVGVAALRSALPWAATSSSAGGSSTSSASGEPANSPGTARSSLLKSNFLQKLQVSARTAVKSPSESVGSAGSFGGALGLPQLQTGFVPGRTKLLPRMPWEPEPVMEPVHTSVDEVEAPEAEEVADAGAAGGDEQECEEEVAAIKSRAVEQAEEAAVVDEDEKVALEEIESPCKTAAKVPPAVVVPAAAPADEVEAAESKKGVEDYDAPPPGEQEGTHKSSSPLHHAADHEDDTSRSAASCVSGAFAFYQDPGAASGIQEPVVGGGAVENFEYYSSCSAGANSGEEVADVMAGIEISARHPYVTDDEIEFLARHLFEFTDAHELEMHFHKLARYRGEEIYVGKGGSMSGTGVSRKSVRLSYFSEYDGRDFDITWPYDLRLEPKPLDQDEKLRAAGLSPSGNKLKPQYQ